MRILFLALLLLTQLTSCSKSPEHDKQVEATVTLERTDVAFIMLDVPKSLSVKTEFSYLSGDLLRDAEVEVILLKNSIEYVRNSEILEFGESDIKNRRAFAEAMFGSFDQDIDEIRIHLTSAVFADGSDTLSFAADEFPLLAVLHAANNFNQARIKNDFHSAYTFIISKSAPLTEEQFAQLLPKYSGVTEEILKTHVSKVMLLNDTIASVTVIDDWISDEGVATDAAFSQTWKMNEGKWLMQY
jgi:hypothetical protein